MQYFVAVVVVMLHQKTLQVVAIVIPKPCASGVFLGTLHQKQLLGSAKHVTKVSHLHHQNPSALDFMSIKAVNFATSVNACVGGMTQSVACVCPVTENSKAIESKINLLF